MTVQDIPEGHQFISDSQDVNAIKESIFARDERENAKDFDSFFVIVGEGDYISVIGMAGIVPYLNKAVEKLI